MRLSSHAFWAIGVVLWLGVAMSGLYVLWAYDNDPGRPAAPEFHWPAGVALPRDPERATLVMLAHPQCTCTRASLTELAEILARASSRPKTYVLFVKPRGFAAGWEQSDLWRTAAALPDVTVVRDDDGAQAARFGAFTSGQTFLYDARGALLFSGGITGARAHAGDNAGRAAVLTLLDRSASRPRAWTSVFGCSLFAPDGERSDTQ